VTITIFSDYQCPFCARFFNETESLLRQNYVNTDKAKMIYKNLAFLGQESIAAAQAAECAKDQGKFWQYHDALFQAETKDGKENNGNLNRNLFKTIASDLKMNTDEFLSCFDSQKYAAKIDNDTKTAESLMTNISTPTIFINDQMIQGAYPYDTFSQVIDGILNKK
jgi:protein-disulfide isomerase